MRRRWERFRTFGRAHPMPWDGLVLLFWLPFIVAAQAAEPANAVLGTPASWVMIACWTVPLLWRRSHPVAVTWIVVAGHVVQLVAYDELLPGNVTVPIMLWTVARFCERRVWARVFLAVGFAGAVLGAADWSFGGGRAAGTWQAFVSVTVTNGLVVACAWGAGLLARQRAVSLEQLRERNAALERERDHHVRLAAEEERTRIAREMHDIVAHKISLVALQAGALEVNPDMGREQVQQSASLIRGTATTALSELREVLGVLRGDEEQAPLAPQPT